MTDSFLTRLREAREAATPGPWGRAFHGLVREWHPDSVMLKEDHPQYKRGNAELICLLVNNSAKIERVIESAEGWLPYLEETNASFADVKELREAIAALNENADE